MFDPIHALTGLAYTIGPALVAAVPLYFWAKA